MDSKQKIVDAVKGTYVRLFERLTRIAPMLLRAAALVAAGVLLGTNTARSTLQSYNPFAGECFYVAPSTDIALGAYIPGASSDPTKIDEFAQTAGATPSVVMWYQDWEHSGVKEFDPKKMDAVVSKGAMPMVTWEPYDWSGGASQPEYAGNQSMPLA